MHTESSYATTSPFKNNTKISSTFSISPSHSVQTGNTKNIFSGLMGPHSAKIITQVPLTSFHKLRTHSKKSFFSSSMIPMPSLISVTFLLKTCLSWSHHPTWIWMSCPSHLFNCVCSYSKIHNTIMLTERVSLMPFQAKLSHDACSITLLKIGQKSKTTNATTFSWTFLPNSINTKMSFLHWRTTIKNSNFCWKNPSRKSSFWPKHKEMPTTSWILSFVN